MTDITDNGGDVTIDQTPVTKRDLVEGRVDKVFREGPPRGEIVEGSFTPSNMAAMMDFAKAMATASQLGEHLRGNVGDCLYLVSKAVHHRLEPYSLAMMSYSVNGRIAFEAKFAVSLVHSSRLLKTRLRYEYIGEGETRQCKVIGHFRSEAEPLEYLSPMLRQITPKKSPLWGTDPDQQLAYFAARAWSRRHCPEVLAGFVFDDEPEIEQRTIDATAVHPTQLLERLSVASAQHEGRPPEGFSEQEIARTLSESSIEPETTENRAAGASPETKRVRATVQQRESENAPASPAARKKGSVSKVAKTKPAPKASKSKLPIPKTPEQYRKWVANWLRDMNTEQDIEARWRSEMKMRNQANLIEQDRLKIRVLVDARIADLRG